MLHLSRPLSVAFAVLVFHCSAKAPEWTRFRGPNGAGVAEAPGLPAQFSDKDFNWKIELPGSGHSSPVIANGRAFLTCVPANSAQRIALAVNTADGKIAWSRVYEGSAFRQHADNSYASMSPAVDAERVYIWWGSPEGSALLALDQKDGRELWKKELGAFNSQHGPGSSPIVFEDSVLLHFDQDQPKSFLVSLDAKTGEERWRCEREGTASTSSTPCIHTAKDGTPEVILISRTVGMTAVDARTGKVTWEIPKLLPKRCVASPIVTGDGLIIAQCGEGRAESFVYAVQPPSDGQPARKVYEVVRVGGYVPSPIAVGKLLFLWKEDGLVTCLRAATNEQLWSERVQGPFYGSPVSVNGRLYSMTRKGELVVLSAGEKFEQLARIPLGEGSHATPSVSGGRMYLRTFTHLISVGR